VDIIGGSKDENTSNEEIRRALKHLIFHARECHTVISIDVNRAVLLESTLFLKGLGDSKYFEHINIGTCVL